MDHELEAVFRSWVERAERDWHAFDHDPAMSELVYFRDVVPYKQLLRSFHLQKGDPVCWGAGDCLITPRAKCTAGKHDTCDEHKTTCFPCRAAAWQPPKSRQKASTARRTMLCPNCHELLDLDRSESFDFILLGRHECQECGTAIIIENGVPRLRREDEPD